MKKIAILIVALCLNGAPLLAQDPPERPPEWPSAQEILDQILDGRRSVPIAVAIRTCPVTNPYGDTIWSALLRVTTSEIVERLSSGWSQALASCGDERIEAWYRARLLEADGYFAAGPFVLALGGLRTPENIEFLKGLAYDGSRPDDLRQLIFEVLSTGRAMNERLDLYLDALGGADQIPGPYDELEAFRLINSDVSARFVRGALETIRRTPTTSGQKLLIALSHYDRVRATPAMRGEVVAAARAIVDAPPGIYASGMVQAARIALEAVGRSP